MRLLERSNRGVSLTAAGSVFYEEMRAVLARLEHARGKALRADQGDIGMLEFSFDFTRPDGSRHSDSSVDVFRYRDGSIASLRAYTDSYPLRQALGIA